LTEFGPAAEVHC